MMDTLPTEMTEKPESRDDLGSLHNAGCARSVAELMRLLKVDPFRYSGNTSSKSFFRHFRFTSGWTLYPPAKFILLHCRYKYRIVIPEYTVVGPGLFINRFGRIYMNGDAIIGSNVNLAHGIMLGQQNRVPTMGSPIFGDCVFIAAGAKIIGRIKLGNDSVIGANAVVTKDVPENAIVGGIPAKVLSMKGSERHINRQARI